MKRILLIALLLGSLGAANAATIDFVISLNGLNEAPPNGSTAAGGGIASFDTVLDTISVSVFFTGLSAPATASHIHLGLPGVPGPVIVGFVPITPSASSGTIISGPVAFPVANIADLLAGNTYFNIHDSVYPGGEIRGQLVPVQVSAPDHGSTLGMLGFALLALASVKRPLHVRAA